MHGKEERGDIDVSVRGLYVGSFSGTPRRAVLGQKGRGTWSIPKGEYGEAEDPLEVAKREFQEETGFSVEGDFILLTPLKQRSGKVISGWAVKGDCDAKSIKSNTFSIEWPPGSGKRRQFPEADRAEWFGIPRAKEKILPGQRSFLEELVRKLGTGI